MNDAIPVIGKTRTVPTVNANNWESTRCGISSTDTPAGINFADARIRYNKACTAQSWRKKPAPVTDRLFLFFNSLNIL
jgi:hypothetical protein